MTHGGGSWSFPSCVWAPSHKNSKKLVSWPYWSKILELKSGDTLFHLSGKDRSAEFVGVSTVSGNGFETMQGPPDPKAWAYARSFFRANLRDYAPFVKSLPEGERMLAANPPAVIRPLYS